MRKILTAGVLAGLLAFGLVACDDAPAASEAPKADDAACTDCTDCDLDSAAQGLAADAAPAAADGCCPGQAAEKAAAMSACEEMCSDADKAMCEEMTDCSMEECVEAEPMCDSDAGCKIETPKIQD